MAVFLILIGAMTGCGPDSRRDQPAVQAPASALIQDTVETGLLLAEIDRIGPGARVDRAARLQLGSAIRNPRPEVASRAAYWLAQAGPASIPTLLATLRDPSTLARTSACYALGLLGPGASGAVPALARQLAGASDSVANMADWALSQVDPTGTARLVPELRALRYGAALERADAASRLALRAEASADAIPILIRALSDPEAMVGDAASEALVRIGSRSVPALQAALLSDDHHLRVRVLLVLSRMRPYSHF